MAATSEVINEGNENSEENGSENQSNKGESGPPPDIIPHNELIEGSVTTNGNGDQRMDNGEVHAPMLQNRQSSKDSAQDDDGSLHFRNFGVQ